MAPARWGRVREPALMGDTGGGRDLPVPPAPSPVPLTYELDAVCPDTGARAGRVHTDHGTIETPMFMPVGTAGTVKALAPRTLRELGTNVLLGNTYHLSLRPGREVLRQLGGLHRFMSWDGPILTDSGGFQVFSLAGLRTMSEDGVTFQNHLNGDTLRFTPENVVDAQRDIGSDIMMVLDECPPATVDRATARISNELTVRWARRAFDPLPRHRAALRPPPGALPDRPGRRLPGCAARERRRARRAGGRGLCRRRAVRRRDGGCDVRDRRGLHGRAPRRPAALPHGRRDAPRT